MRLRDDRTMMNYKQPAYSLLRLHHFRRINKKLAMKSSTGTKNSTSSEWNPNAF